MKYKYKSIKIPEKFLTEKEWEKLKSLVEYSGLSAGHYIGVIIKKFIANKREIA